MSYFAELRREYQNQSLSRDDLDNNPFKQFSLWMDDAINAKIDLPNAMSLATYDTTISIRTVLLKSFNEEGFVFFTNYNSKKSKQIANNPSVALLFPWLSINRQIKISGLVNKISKTESAQYFTTRPVDSQIAAICSNQSSEVESRAILLKAFERTKQKFNNKLISIPNFWGGYRVIPETIEFWQGQENRLHDRFIYQKQDQGWRISRLNP